jgi:hypothetical protein
MMGDGWAMFLVATGIGVMREVPEGHQQRDSPEHTRYLPDMQGVC